MSPRRRGLRRAPPPPCGEVEICEANFGWGPEVPSQRTDTFLAGKARCGEVAIGPLTRNRSRDFDLSTRERWVIRGGARHSASGRPICLASGTRNWITRTGYRRPCDDGERVSAPA